MVERTCVNAVALGVAVTIHVVDPFVDTGSRVWTTTQSSSLLMNTIASQVTVFTDDSVTCAGPIRPGPSLYEWAKTVPLLESFDTYPPEVLAEADGMTPDSYPTRAFYGYYLNWVLRMLRDIAPVGVSIHLHRQTAVALRAEPGGQLVIQLSDGSHLVGLSAVVLAQGHLDMEIGAQEQRLARQAAACGLRYVAPASPAEVDLDVIAAGEPVVLRGMGLNFFDYLTMLTVDRGGRFIPAGCGRHGLRYLASGDEPLIYAGSRRGVPYHARGENEKGVSGRHHPVFLTDAVIRRFRARAQEGSPANFHTDVWPLISREVELVYYTALITERDGARAALGFRARFSAAATDSDVDELLAGVPASERWDWDRVAHPDGGRHFGSPDEFHEWLLRLLREDVAQARRGNVTSPVKAALDVLRDIRNEVRLIVDHRGLSGWSYREELRESYTPLNAYLSIGPPARRIEELVALIEAGVVRVFGPGMRVGVGKDAFLVDASAVTGSMVTAKTLIEARLPDVDILHTTDPLVTDLLAAGRCRPYYVPDPDGVGYMSGGLDVTESPYHVIDSVGEPQARLFAYGVPTETVHWVTAAGARPGVDSVMLGDADAIARAALTCELAIRDDLGDILQRSVG